MRITDLGKIQLQRLRNDIVLNSLYTADYNNRYGIDPHEVQDFFDGYIEYLGELEQEKYGHEIDTQDFFAEFDNIENLLEWQYMCMDGIEGCRGIGAIDWDYARWKAENELGVDFTRSYFENSWDAVIDLAKLGKKMGYRRSYDNGKSYGRAFFDAIKHRTH